MPDHTTDTHALVWYLTGSQLLSVTAKRIFDNVVNGSGQIYIPAIVLAEMVMIIEKRRVVMDLPHMIAIMRNYTGFLFTSLSPQIVLRSQSLTILPDIHDRLIVTEALELGTNLITRDIQIQASNLVQTVW